VAVFLSIVVSIMVRIDYNYRGTRQGNIKHAPRISSITPIRVTTTAMDIGVTMHYRKTIDIENSSSIPLES
jgi:hypothetical protein